jgi:hypothetical protein
MDLKELQADFKKSWDEIKELLQKQAEQLETHTEVLEQLIEERQ